MKIIFVNKEYYVQASSEIINSEILKTFISNFISHSKHKTDISFVIDLYKKFLTTRHVWQNGIKRTSCFLSHIIKARRWLTNNEII